MKHRRRIVLAALACIALGAGPPRPEPNRVEIETVMKKVYPALVRILVVIGRHSQGRQVKALGTGSGAIISADGYVVTNHHVVGHATRIYCTLSNREWVEAKLIGTDAMADIAVIKLLPETMRRPVKQFPFAEWGESSHLKVGQKVFAMGSPGSLAQSVTYGIIANPGMVLPGRGLTLDGEPVGRIVRWIIHDAQIYGGNSGGPLVDTGGRIIGINEINIVSLGGAIPANTARQAAAELIKHGYIERSWTGLRVQTLLHADPSETGVLVNGVVSDSPADVAGIRSGDKIVAVDGTAVTVRFGEQMPAFHAKVLGAPVGSKLKLTLQRDGQNKDVTLVTGARGKARAEQQIIPGLGITARNITRLAMLSQRLDSQKGAQVATVRPGGPAGQAKPALRGGDVILSVGGKAVADCKQLLQISKDITAEQDEGVPTVVVVSRGGQQLLTVVEIGPEPEPPVVPEARKAWFPASVQVLTKPMGKALGLEGTKGVRITRLYWLLEGSGFQVGDILTHVRGQLIDASTGQHTERFPSLIRRQKIGRKTTFSVIRDKKKTEVVYALPRAPKPGREMSKYRNDVLEFGARSLSVMDRIGRRLPKDQKGAIVHSVKTGGWAQLGGLRTGDIILEVSGTAVKSAKGLKAAMAKVEEAKPESIIFFVKRGIGHFYAELRPDWPDQP